jgi:intracellular sulfur oxidation DsrE/DsrF family protein
MRAVPYSIAVFCALIPAIAFAQAQPATPSRLVPDFGAYSEIPDAFQKPDPAMRYKIVFDVSQPARTPGAVHQGLERVARMMNLLHSQGVKIEPGDIVVTLHGGAAKTALTAPAFAKRYADEANPNAQLIAQITKAGASVRLCGQSMAALGFTRDELNPDVKVDTSAITTIGTLLMRGYGMIQD